MSRSLGFVALIMAGILAVTMLGGSLIGTFHTLSASMNSGQSTMSSMAVGYATLGVMLGMSLTSLMRFSWSELPKIVSGFFRGKRRSFELLALAGIFGAVIVFY